MKSTTAHKDPLQCWQRLFRQLNGENAIWDDCFRRLQESPPEKLKAAAEMTELTAKKALRSIGVNTDGYPTVLDVLPYILLDMDTWAKMEAIYEQLPDADKAQISSRLPKLKLPGRIRKALLRAAKGLPHQSGGHPKSSAAQDPAQTYEAVKRLLDQGLLRTQAYKRVGLKLGTTSRTIQGIFLLEEKRRAEVRSSGEEVNTDSHSA